MKECAGSIMDVETLARYLDVSVRTVYRLTEKKEIPASKVGRQWRYEKQAIDEWLKWRRI